VRDIPDKLDGIVDDLFGAVDALELGVFIEIDHVLVEVETGGGEQRAGIVVQVGGDPGPFFFLQPDRGVEQEFLLLIFHFLQGHLVPDDFTLVKDDKNDQADGEHEHADRAEI